MAPIKFQTYLKSTEVIKTRFAKLEENVNKIVSTEDPLTAVQIRKLNTYFVELKKKRSDFEIMVNRIHESDVDEANNTIISADMDTVNDLYVNISSLIEVAILPDPTTPHNTSADDMTHQALPSLATAHVHLPQLHLQTFDGSPLKWVSFINLFDTTVHKNASLSNVAKFQYLLSILSNEPLDMVKSLNLTAPNYLIAYNMLRERFHNPRRLSTLHIHAIIDIASVAYANSKQMRAFITTFNTHSHALQALDCDVTHNNPFLSAHILRKLDNKIVQNLEQYRRRQENFEPHSLPETAEIIKFLKLECAQIEDASLHTDTFSENKKTSHVAVKPKTDFRKTGHFFKETAMLATPSLKEQCFCCKSQDHKIYSCTLFKDKSPNERYKMVKTNQRCVSCLGKHHISKCQSTVLCKTCRKPHHSLLHFDARMRAHTDDASSQPPIPTPSSTTLPALAQEATLSCATTTHVATQHSVCLLGTALVQLTTPQGRSHVLRALLDSGSTADFITEKAAQLLGGPSSLSNISVTGISQATTHTKGLMYLDVNSLSGRAVAKQHTFHILENLSVNIPRVSLAPEVIAKTKPFVLADPTFGKSGPIDILIGCSLFPRILTNERHSLGVNMPYALGTIFGFIIMGQAPCLTPPRSVSNMAISLLSTTDIDLHSALQRFWTQEELPSCNKKTSEEIECDKLFATTHKRDQNGRYVLRLPFKADPHSLGLSQQTAEQRLHSIERKCALNKNSEFNTLYVNFMEEYLSLGHMQPCKSLDKNTPHYFLPHHGVLKAQSSTTKLRVVFDASAKSSSGLSLNDILMTGPKLQNNICDILLHFRLHNVVFSCDIRQMYRQIGIHPADQPFQLVLWRDNPSQPLSTYQLTTVTYGMNCSPYLAIKTLQQLAKDEGAQFPCAAEILKYHSFVDDLIAGASTEEEAAELQEQLINLLHRGGFELRKWVSNSPRLLQDLPTSHHETPVFLQSASEPHFSILGLHWSPVNDSFKYNLNFTCDSPTKRKVLSLIAQIYDPCGFLSPCTMSAKCFMQLLWVSGTSWDEPLSPELTLKWKTFVSDLSHIVDIKIPRALQIPSMSHCELHGFSDASESGYAAVIYLRCSNDSGVRVTQVIAKTRVAPLKKVTLPRLELCAAHLLAHLTGYCINQLKPTLKINSTTLWSDSTVALSWLQTPPYRLKTYVANRVAQVQELVPLNCWRHISGSHNPADCASRGILASQLVDHPLWWHRPSWLQLPPSQWPSSDFVPLDIADMVEVKTMPLTVLLATPPQCDLLLRFSSWTKLLHVMAYILRFISYCRRKQRHKGSLSVQEVEESQRFIFKLVQHEAFPDDFKALQLHKTCSSRIQRLAPFVDQQGLLRVGGRLHHADLPPDIRHPCILPKKHHVVNLLIDFTHHQHLHAGVQLTLSLLAQQVWILAARSVVRSRIFQCLTCFKNKPRNTAPLMGDLPSPRITPARPFLSTGVDYGGPFIIKIHNLRSIRHIKAYICVFVCFVTKAVHIEVVTDLSTDAFLAALTRFVSRRGLCSDIYSDCATNFIGAKNVLRNLVVTEARQRVENFSLQHHINFHFNPPAAPHQGGLWESAIKSVKYHLKRVLGTHVPTLSHFITLNCQIEAMLNSRPITALSSDPNDLQALTPGHFLIGSPLVSLPEPALHDISDNRLSDWHLQQALKQRLWKRWSQEYLHTLQQRLKWNQSSRNLQVGDLVLVHQDSSPLNWPLARIIKVTPGHDNTVRVVTFKTQSGVFTRPAIKVFLLPFLKN